MKKFKKLLFYTNMFNKKNFRPQRGLTELLLKNI